MQTAIHSLQGQFLIAMPAQTGGMFQDSLTYVCEHSDTGAMGIIVNRPLDLTLAEILDKLPDTVGSAGAVQVMAGGPVSTERGFVLHDGGDRWQSTLMVSEEIALSISNDIIQDLLRDKGPQRFLIALGYAGWSAGQLDDEIAQNAWLTVPADSDILFDTPFSERVTLAASRNGIDLSKLALHSGHA